MLCLQHLKGILAGLKTVFAWLATEHQYDFVLRVLPCFPSNDRLMKNLQSTQIIDYTSGSVYVL